MCESDHALPDLSIQGKPLEMTRNSLPEVSQLKPVEIRKLVQSIYDLCKELPSEFTYSGDKKFTRADLLINLKSIWKELSLLDSGDPNYDRLFGVLGFIAFGARRVAVMDQPPNTYKDDPMLTSCLTELIYAENPQNTLGETGAPNAYFELGGKLFGEVANHIEHLATGMLGGNPYNPGKDIHDYLKELDPDKTKSTLVTLKRLYAKITEQVVMRPEIMDSFQELIDLRQKASLLYSSIVQSEKPGYLYSPTEAQRLTDKYAEVNAEIKKIENEIFGDPNTGSPAFTNSEPKLN